ncbi:hypothetical protein COOONC_17755 [Cooperia oncophora]
MNRWLIALLLVVLNIEMYECNCYDNWSRCTPQTKFATGILWKDCPDYCKKCKGQPSGQCVRVTTSLSAAVTNATYKVKRAWPGRRVGLDVVLSPPIAEEGLFWSSGEEINESTRYSHMQAWSMSYMV